MATVGGVGQSLQEDLVRSKSRMFCDGKRKDDDGECQSGEAECGCPGEDHSTKEAQLNCVSLPSQFDCEVTYGAVKSQDERLLRRP